MELHTLKPAKGSVKSKKRVGRGVGSGRGKTSTRGHNGQQSRSGYSAKKGFEGGQMPLQRRTPKRGFKSLNKVSYQVFNLTQVSELSEKYGLEEFSVEKLYEIGVINSSAKVKILSDGELSVKKTIKVHAVSKKAEKAIKESGCTLELI